MNNITNTLDNSSKKRKTYDLSCVGGFAQPRAKKVRTKRGALNELVNQPGDVMYEVRSSMVYVNVLTLN